MSELCVKKTLVVVPLFAALALTTGCGGGGSSGPLRVFADGDPITGADYGGKTFPLYFIVGQDDDAGAVIKGGEGRITISDDGNTVRISIPGEDTLTFTFAGVDPDGDLYEGFTPAGDPITVTVTIQDNGEYAFARCGCGEFEGFDYASVFGFETPTSLRPMDSVTYTGMANGVIFAAEGDPEYLLIPGGGSGELTANFAGGSISGTLIDAFTTEALPASFSDFDEVTGVGAVLTMEGSITSTGFDGTVDGDIFVYINELPFTLATTFSDTDVDGKFFGNAGETAAAVYDGNVTAIGIGPEGSDVDATFEGFFVGTDLALDPT